MAVLQNKAGINYLTIYMYFYTKERRRQRRRICWTRPWILRGPQFGMYDQLMVELRRDDEAAFINFMRMASEMFDELLHRISPRITKKHTSFRGRLPSGMKLPITLRHLASDGVKVICCHAVWLKGATQHNFRHCVRRLRGHLCCV